MRTGNFAVVSSGSLSRVSSRVSGEVGRLRTLGGGAGSVEGCAGGPGTRDSVSRSGSSTASSTRDGDRAGRRG